MLTVEAEGEGRLAQLLDLVHLGDWTSYPCCVETDAPPRAHRRHHAVEGGAGLTPGRSDRPGAPAALTQKCDEHHGDGSVVKNRSARVTAPLVSSRTRPAAANVDTGTPPR